MVEQHSGQLKKWAGNIKDKDDFGDSITDTFIDGKTKYGPWAIMTPASFKEHGISVKYGTGQKYQKQNNDWILVKGGR